MMTPKILLSLGCGLLALVIAVPSARAQSPSFAPFVVVELFTSEGCSSCPPAETIFRSVSEQAWAKHLRIFPLAFHVDYWDRLGWVDPYSSPAFTQRQADYAKALHVDTYTPQLIVNGQNAFAGYRRDLLQEHMDQWLRQLAPVSVRLSLAPADPFLPRRLNLHWTVAGLDATRSYRMNVAIVERGLTSKVLRGENAGQTLTHENVVRFFKSGKARNGSGDLSLELPVGIKRPHAALIMYIQDDETWAVEGAEQIYLDMPKGKAVK